MSMLDLFFVFCAVVALLHHLAALPVAVLALLEWWRSGSK